MCHSHELFVDFEESGQDEKVLLGDGRSLEVVGKGTVLLSMSLPNNETKRCKLLNTLYVPKLSVNLFSIAKATRAGKLTSFDDEQCNIKNQDVTVIANAKRVGSLYYLEFNGGSEQLNAVGEAPGQNVWHSRYGHIGTQSLGRLARDNLVMPRYSLWL